MQPGRSPVPGRGDYHYFVFRSQITAATCRQIEYVASIPGAPRVMTQTPKPRTGAGSKHHT